MAIYQLGIIYVVYPLIPYSEPVIIRCLEVHVVDNDHDEEIHVEVPQQAFWFPYLVLIMEVPPKEVPLIVANSHLPPGNRAHQDARLRTNSVQAAGAYHLHVRFSVASLSCTYADPCMYHVNPHKSATERLLQTAPAPKTR